MVPNDQAGDGYGAAGDTDDIPRGQTVTLYGHPFIDITIEHDGGARLKNMDSVYIDFTTDAAGAVTSYDVQYGAGIWNVASSDGTNAVNRTGLRTGKKYGSATGNNFQFYINPATGPNGTGTGTPTYAPAAVGDTIQYFFQPQEVVDGADVGDARLGPGTLLPAGKKLPAW
jgi:hypothetical protein